jgi:hypothetical protein
MALLRRRDTGRDRREVVAAGRAFRGGRRNGPGSTRYPCAGSNATRALSMVALVYDVRAARETSKPGGDVAERRRESVTTTPVAGVTLEDVLAGGAVVNDAPKARQPFTGARRFDQQLGSRGWSKSSRERFDPPAAPHRAVALDVHLIYRQWLTNRAD